MAFISRKMLRRTAGGAVALHASVLVDGVRDVAGLGAGDSRYVRFAVPADVADAVFDQLRPVTAEGALLRAAKATFVANLIFHLLGKATTLPRQKAFQFRPRPGPLEVQSVYAYAAGQGEADKVDAVLEPFSEPVLAVLDCLRRAGFDGVDLINHAVINYYPSSVTSGIGPHRDKTESLADGSLIITLSFGARRPCVLRSNDKSVVQEIALHHGSAFVLGPQTNGFHPRGRARAPKGFKHEIPKLAAELGPRLSITLRTCATFRCRAPGSPDWIYYGKGTPLAEPQAHALALGRQ
jgi:alkylated DNA repair dioxygenase AlkB